MYSTRNLPTPRFITDASYIYSSGNKLEQKVCEGTNVKRKTVIKFSSLFLLRVRLNSYTSASFANIIPFLTSSVYSTNETRHKTQFSLKVRRTEFSSRRRRRIKKLILFKNCATLAISLALSFSSDFEKT